MTTNTKRCTKCKEVKSPTEFHKDSRRKDSLQSRCKPCGQAGVAAWKKANPDRVRARVVNKVYGISVQTYEEMLCDQDACCSICAVAFEQTGKKPNVDHCHETGNVRGLLCGPCNKMLGMARDTPSILQRAIKYLEASRG
jgi:hypothetical protein